MCFDAASGPMSARVSVEHESDVDRADLRLAATKEIAHATQDAARKIDLGNSRRQVLIGAHKVDLRIAQQLLDRSPERTRGGHRLIDFMRQGSRHPADEAETRGVGHFGFLLLEPRFGFPRHALARLALADDHADDQAGRRQNKHQHLELRKNPPVVAMMMEQSNKAELRCRKCKARTIQPMPHRTDHDGKKQQVEQCEPVGGFSFRDQPKRDNDDHGEHGKFGNPHSTS